MKIAVQKKNLVGQIWYISLDPVKKKRLHPKTTVFFPRKKDIVNRFTAQRKKTVVFGSHPKKTASIPLIRLYNFEPLDQLFLPVRESMSDELYLEVLDYNQYVQYNKHLLRYGYQIGPRLRTLDRVNDPLLAVLEKSRPPH